MFSKKMYIVATTTALHDVRIEDVYDADVFTLDSILTGLRKRLENRNTQVSIVGDDAYIDIIDANDELVKTYSIISKNTFIKKHIL